MTNIALLEELGFSRMHDLHHIMPVVVELRSMNLEMYRNVSFVIFFFLDECQSLIGTQKNILRLTIFLWWIRRELVSLWLFCVLHDGLLSFFLQVSGGGMWLLCLRLAD